jgi:hypothetical protein
MTVFCKCKAVKFGKKAVLFCVAVLLLPSLIKVGVYLKSLLVSMCIFMPFVLNVYFFFSFIQHV